MTILWVLSIWAVTQQNAVGQKYLDSYVGCAWDARHRDMKKYYGSGNTIQSCRIKAAKGGYKFFGLQVGHECFAGNTYGSKGFPGADSYCWGGKKGKEKSEERMQQHGSNWMNAVYMTKEQWFTVKKDKSMVRKGTVVGCYWDDRKREYKAKFKNAKKKLVTSTTVNSVQECGKLAVANKMNFFAIQVGKQCFMSKKMFNRYPRYPATFGQNACVKSKPKKVSKQWGNFGGAAWTNAIYFAKPSLYYPAAFWDTIGGDDTIRLVWANAYCLNVQFARYVKGAKIILYHCVNGKAETSANMKWVVTGGKIKVKASPTWCITLPKLAKNQQLVLDKCGAKKAIQDVQMYDDQTVRFKKKMSLGFNVRGGIGSGDKINNRPLQSYPVSSANNEAFLIRAAAPPTPKPTPKPTPAPPLTGLKKAKGWSIAKGKCTIDISSGTPCAVTPNYPKPYSADHSCLVKMTKTKAVKAAKFVTEKYFDVVAVGRVKMHGAHKTKPTFVLAKGVDAIHWTSDFYLEGQGWKLCKTKKPSLKLPGMKKKKRKKGKKSSRKKKNSRKKSGSIKTRRRRWKPNLLRRRRRARRRHTRRRRWRR